MDALAKIKAVETRLYSENRMTGDEMRDAAQQLTAAREEMAQLLPPGPTHTNDCKRCQYLHSETLEGQTVDWYRCPKRGGTNIGDSIIGRFGSEGPEYWSMPASVIESVEERDWAGSSYMKSARKIVAERKKTS